MGPTASQTCVLGPRTCGPVRKVTQIGCSLLASAMAIVSRSGSQATRALTSNSCGGNARRRAAESGGCKFWLCFRAFLVRKECAMTNRTTFLVFVLAAGLAGCDDGAPAPGPTAPLSVPAPPTYPPAGYSLSHVTLSGVVFEETVNGRAPIEAVAVYCEFCSAGTHAWSSTDSNGSFSFAAVWTNPSRFPTSIWIGKDGYADPEGRLGLK